MMNVIDSEKPENLLVKQASEGNMQAYEELIRAYQKKVYNIAFRMMGNSEDAEDIAQETFIKVYRSLSKFRGDSAFSTWLYRIATNISIDQLRKKKNRMVVYIDNNVEGEEGDIQRQLKDDSPSPEDIAETKELKNTVQNAINRLSPDHKAVIVLRDIKGLQYDEIARILNCPEGTIKSRINRARLSLHSLLSGNRELFDIKDVTNI